MNCRAQNKNIKLKASEQVKRKIVYENFYECPHKHRSIRNGEETKTVEPKLNLHERLHIETENYFVHELVRWLSGRHKKTNYENANTKYLSDLVSGKRFVFCEGAVGVRVDLFY